MPSVNEAYLNFYYEKTSVFNGAYDNALKITSRYNNNVININQYSGEYPFNEYVPGIVNIQYSLDNGMTWNDINDDGTLCTLSAGQSVLLKGTNTNTYYQRGEPYPLAFNWCIGSTYEYDVSGNPLSLIVEDSFDKIDDLTDIGDEYGHPTERLLEGLFYHSQVVDASGLQLKAKTLTTCCYTSMFKDCMVLEKAPKLPATTLANYCYSYMFDNCSMALTTAPDLPATTLAPRCYDHMFNNCSSLISPPNILPATTLADFCYYAMFYNCGALIYAPTLPATALAPSCYSNMFVGCESLTTAPSLPATTLAVACYMGMFNSCTSLTTAPLLPATTLSALCYAIMFGGCENLNYIKILATSRESSSLTDWVVNVAPTGTFVKDANATYPIDSDSGVPIGWTVYNINEYIPSNYNVVLDVYPTGAGSVYGGGTYVEETSITINAVASVGYYFIGWYDRDDFMEYGPSIDPVSRNAIYTFTVTNNTSLFAVFDTEPHYSVILSQTPNVGATLTGAGSYMNGTIATVTASSVEGYNFVGWKLNGAIVSRQQTYTFTVNTNISLVANYEVIPVYTDCNVVIQINNKNLGTVSYTVLQPDGTLVSGTIGHSGQESVTYTWLSESVITLQANPDDNSRFVRWKKDGTEYSTLSNIQFTLSDNTIIIAELEINQYINSYLTIQNLYSGANEISILYADAHDRLCPTQTMTLQYRINNNGPWYNYTARQNIAPQQIVTLNRNDIISFRNFSVCGHVVTLFAAHKYRVYGNVMSLLPAHFDSENSTDSEYHGINTTVLSSDDNFAYLFALRKAWINNDYYEHGLEQHVFDAADLILPATTLSERCYQGMLSSAWELTNTPDLPATTLAPYCYYIMFAASHDITSVPELPATTLAEGCYSGMFHGCYGLTSIPSNLLPATTLATNCYHDMFKATEITTVPSGLLPATTLAEGCYSGMFTESAVRTVQSNLLPATTLTPYCYAGMFMNCFLLTTVPSDLLPATTLTNECYQGMFFNCESLVTAPALPATTLAQECYFCMFMNCTSLTTAPALPATTLQNSCYNSMFYQCTSLATAPSLPATILVSNCYNSMFELCSNLNNVTCLATDISADNCTMRWLADVKNTGTFTKAASMTYWITGVSGIPANWTVQNAS